MANENLYRVFDFSGGLASAYNAELVSENEQKDVLNMVYDERGNFKKRSGLKIDQNLPGTNNGSKVVQIYSYVKYSSGVEEMIVVYADGSIKGYDGTDLYPITTNKSDGTPYTYSLSTGTGGTSYLSTSSVVPTFFNLSDTMYMIDMVNGGFRYEGRANTGTAAEVFTRVDTIPKSSMAVVKNNRVFYSGDPQNPDFLYFSQLANAESIDMTINDAVNGGATVVGGGGIIRVLSEDAKIMGIVDFNDALVIFKKDRAYTLTGVDPNSDFKLQSINIATGSVAPRTVVKGNNMVYWLSKEGVFTITSPLPGTINAKALSVRVNDQIDFSLVDESKTYAYFDGKRYNLVINYQNDTKMLIYDEVYNTWTKFDYLPSAIEYSPKTRDTYLAVGENIVTRVKGQLKDETSPNVYSPIDGKIITAYYRLKEPEVSKRFRYVMVFFKPNQVEDSIVNLKIEIDYKDSYREIDSEYIGMIFGQGKYAEAYWGVNKDELSQQVRFGGTGKMIRFTFENNRMDEDMEIHGLVIGYKKKSRIK